jgi:hypothetical protein
MKNLILIFVIVFTFDLKAQDFSKLYNLSEDIRDVILKAPGGNPMPEGKFQLTTGQSDQVQALASLDESMKKHLELLKDEKDCEKSKASKASAKLISRVDNRPFQLEGVVFAHDKKFEEVALGSFTSDGYIAFMSSLYQTGNLKSLDVYDVSSLEQKYKFDHPVNNLDSLDLVAKSDVLQAFAEAHVGAALPKDTLLKEMVFQKMVTDSKDWKATLDQIKDKLSSDEKLQLVSKLGGSFLARYNHERLNQGLKASGSFVSTEQLLDSVKNGTVGGICRDIALAQTQFLERLGFKNNYVVVFKSNLGWHATTISTDPVNGKVVKLNYSDTSEMKKGSGTEALIQDSTLPDHGIVYRVYDTNGKPVTMVDSEIGQMLKDTAGGVIQKDFSPKNYTLSKVAFKSALGEGNLFVGKTSNGENLYGIAISKKFTPNEYITIQGGASLSKMEGDGRVVQIEQQNLYSLLSTELTTPKLKLGANEVSGFAGASASLLISKSTEFHKTSGWQGSSENGADFSGEMYAGVQNKYTSSDNNNVVDSKVYANFYPDWHHVAKGDHITNVLDSVVVTSGVTHNFTEQTRAMVDTAVIMKNYGTSVVLNATYIDDSNGTKYTAGIASPLSKNMPTYLPGGERRAFASIEKNTDKIVYTIEYERNLDNKSNGVTVKAKVKF